MQRLQDVRRPENQLSLRADHRVNAAVHIALLGFVLSRTMFRGERMSFVMELPRYSLPSPAAVGLSVFTAEALHNVGSAAS